MATILIVDDRPTNRELAVTLLGYAGHRMLEASEGEEGLAVARAERPDLIITDIVMPTMDGYEFARQVRADPNLSKTQIIFHTSSHIVEETRRLAEACGVSMVLSKPVEPEYFLEQVTEALATQHIPSVKPVSEDFHLAHMRLLTDTLANKVEQLEAEITERSRAEEALQASEELFRSAFQYSPVGMCITTVDGRLQTVNQAFGDMLGFAMQELEGKHFDDITYADDLEVGWDVVNKMQSGELQSVSFEKRYLHKSGEPVWTLVSSTLLRDSSSSPIHFITQILNITERKRAEEQVRAHAARLKVLADASQTFATAVHDYQEMLEMVARQTAEAMDGSCGIRLLSEDGEWLEMAALYDVDSKALELARMLSSQPMRADEPNFVQRIMQSQQAILMPGVSEDQLRAVIKPENWDHLKYIASHSRLLAPIRTRSQALGFLIISRKVGSQVFDEHDLSLAQDLADRAALAISNARLFKQVQNELTERQRTEAARLESEARYHRVLDAMMEGCQIIDFDWRYVYVNDVVVAQGKETRAELLNHTMMEVYPGIENTELFAVLRQCMEERTPRRLENQFAFPDGSIGWFELSIQPAREGIFILSSDITERKRAEEQLHKSEKKFSDAFHSSPAAITITRIADGTFIDANDEFLNTFEFTRDQVLGHTSIELNILGPEARRLLIERQLATGGLQNAELEAQSKSGKTITILFSSSHIDINDEAHHITTMIDITERKRAEEKLRQSEENFSKAFSSSPTALMITRRADGKYLELNEAYISIVGYDRIELIGHLTTEFNIFIDADQRKEIVSQLVARGALYNYEAQIQNKSGEVRTVLASLEQIQFNGEACILTTLADITERKQAEEALREKNEEIKRMSQQLWQAAKLATMGELAASIAHELNNPLATISLRTEMLQSQFAADDAPFKSLNIIESEVSRMSSLVANLLQFSRRSSFQVSTIHVNEEVVDTLELIQYHLRKNSILTVQELSPDLALVQADRQQLRQVFLNLFTNAADAMPLGGMLTIRTWSGEKPDAGITAPLRRSATQSLGLPAPDVPQVFIEVSDTGEGIPPEKLERVWEAFYTTKPEGKGTGLGLAICRRIIQEHAGTIDITSDGIPGKGTTVRLSLPAVKEM